jgi:hypothetical protein
LTVFAETLEERRIEMHKGIDMYQDYGARKRSGEWKLLFKEHEYCNCKTEY